VAFSTSPRRWVGPMSLIHAFKVNGIERSESGSLSVSVSKGRGMGFGHEKPGSTTVLLRCAQNSAAKFERSMRARRHTEQAEIDSLDPDPDSDNDRTDRTDRTDRQPLPGGDAGASAPFRTLTRCPTQPIPQVGQRALHRVSIPGLPQSGSSAPQARKATDSGPCGRNSRRWRLQSGARLRSEGRSICRCRIRR
jgi:hypothetical protein